MLITVDVKAGSNRDSVELIEEGHYMVHVRLLLARERRTPL